MWDGTPWGDVLSATIFQSQWPDPNPPIGNVYGDCNACPNPGGAEVPELSSAAAAGFLGLALLVGWRVRRSYRPVS